MTWDDFERVLRKAEAGDQTRCPTCGEQCEVMLPAEPDVGISVDLFECAEHGPFYFDENSVGQFPSCFQKAPEASSQ